MAHQKVKKKISPLPYSYYFFVVTLIALIGFLDAIYLSISHFRVYTDISYESFCAISRSLNCDTVSQSPYSILIGVPVPFWGIIGYTFFLVLLVFAWPPEAEKRRIWTILLGLSLLFSGYSIILAFISAYLIHSYCLMCILSYAVNLLLVYFVWLVRKRFQCESIFTAIRLDFFHLLAYPRLIVAVALIFFAVIFSTYQIFPEYWKMSPPVFSKDISKGVTEDGYPWIGAEHPKVTITEFSDYLCFQCNKMHFFIRRLVEKYSDRIRLVHRHLPMDHVYNPLVAQPFHTGAGKMAIIALYAQEKDQFWNINDLLFNLGARKNDFNTRTIAKAMNISPGELTNAMNSRFLRFKLKHDIAIGIEQGIKGTPGFIIDGQVYLGTIPGDVLEKIQFCDE